MPPPPVSVRTDDPLVTVVTLDRPEKRNALNRELIERLHDAVRGAAADLNRRVLLLRGQSVPAPRALELGLANRLTSPERLDEAALELAHQACAGAPGAVARSKRLLDELAPRPIAEDLRRALAYHLGARNSAEAAE